ncbi:YqaA family protein [Ferrimonas aestuarii]|uniref:DedA family protein n=1 Tax=Ferrimonas aestuarii TaxID=2569539 RepID=A0A4V5NW72_9GAMM|nr:YqaA family protein [Ferrimonas aestuarii]TKB55458.1 DedA family protein [Ferrimonas aestuarii]
MAASAFTSATLLPGGSEVLLAYLVTQLSQHWWWWVLVASVANALGSMTSFAMGYLGNRYRSPQEMIPVKHHWLIVKVERFGPVSLLFAWLPIIGDGIPLLAGWFRFSVIISSLLIFLGKFCRYLLIALTTLGLTNPA